MHKDMLCCRSISRDIGLTESKMLLKANTYQDKTEHIGK